MEVSVTMGITGRSAEADWVCDGDRIGVSFRPVSISVTKCTYPTMLKTKKALAIDKSLVEPGTPFSSVSNRHANHLHHASSVICGCGRYVCYWLVIPPLKIHGFPRKYPFVWRFQTHVYFPIWYFWDWWLMSFQGMIQPATNIDFHRPLPVGSSSCTAEDLSNVAWALAKLSSEAGELFKAGMAHVDAVDENDDVACVQE